MRKKEIDFMKKILSCFLVCAFLCTGLYGCGSKKTELIEEAKDLTLSQEISITPEQNDYGIPAYNFLKHIQSNYPGRVAGTEKETEMAVFILSVLLNGGYAESDIAIESFEIDDSTPMMDEAIQNVFDGGEKSNSSQNILITKKGESEKTIIVGAHYDSAGTHGVDDNGSGVSVALENALRMVNTPTYYTIQYVFFGSEEPGMYGSRAYVESLSENERENIILMINIDTVLAGDYLYLYGGKVNDNGTVDNTEAVFKAYEIVKEIGLNIQLPPDGNNDYPYPTGQKRSDHAPFNDIGIPYIYFEANNWENGSPVETEKNGLIMHTDMDDLDFIENEYSGRVQNTLSSYSTLLYSLLQENNWEQ